MTMNPLMVLYEYGKAHKMDRDPFFEENEVEFLLHVGRAGKWELERLQGSRGRRGMPMHLPIPVKKTSGIRSGFPAENPAYVLGVELDEEKPDLEWTARCHKDYVKLMRRVAGETRDRDLGTVADLLERTKVREFDAAARELGMKSGDTVCPALRVDGAWQAVSERQTARVWWRKNFGTYSKMQGEVMQCQITGEKRPIARIHPLVTGMKGGRSTGITLVTNHEPCVKSFGRDQGDNAPISLKAAVVISKALSRLVSQKSGKRRCVMLPGFVYAVFVPRKDAEERAADFVLSLLDPLESDVDVEREGFAGKDVRVWRSHRALFGAPDTGAALPPPDAAVDILFVRPHGARIEFRNCFEQPFDSVHRNLRRYFDDLAVVDPFQGRVRSDFAFRNVWWRPDGPRGKPARLMYGLMDALRNENKARKDWKDRGEEDPRWEVQSEVFLAAIEGRPFPPEILRLALARVSRAANDPRYGAVPVECAALLKAYLNREARRPETGLLRRWLAHDPNFERVKEMLDPENRYPPYVGGRAIALAERAQETAIPGVVGSVVVRLFEAASKSPGTVLPGVIANMQNHIAKIGRTKRGLAYWFQKQLDEVLGLLPPEREKAFPKWLDPQDQGIFELGYYHQRAKLFEKKNGDKKEGPVDGAGEGEAETDVGGPAAQA